MVFDKHVTNSSERRITVFFVEDDERLARLTAQYMLTHNVEVTIVTRDDLAFPEIMRVRPDVILLDLDVTRPRRR